MKARARLLWGWPEILEEVPGLRDELGAFADVVLPVAGEKGPFDIVVPSLSQELDREAIMVLPGLKIIGTPTTGSDHIDVAFAESLGIRVITTKNERAMLDSIQSTAELAWLLILACQRNLRDALQQVADGDWNGSAVRGHEMIGKTLGIIGHGRLGSMMSRFAQAFRMHVLATDPLPIDDAGVKRVPFETLLAEADILTVHIHLTDVTHGLFNAAAFQKMKSGAVFVNTSRGGVVDEEALVAALESGRLAAAGLDVICHERDPERSRRPLLRYAAAHTNLIITPHVGGFTFEAQAKAFRHFVQLLKQAWRDLEKT